MAHGLFAEENINWINETHTLSTIEMMVDASQLTDSTSVGLKNKRF